MRLLMAALLIEDNALGVQCAQIAGSRQEDIIENLKGLIGRFAGQQDPRKRDRRIDIVWLLLQRIAQSLLISIPTEAVWNSFAHARIDRLGVS
ncbi:hypothetical protein BLN97_06035 [Bradyrhizobium elkanii]|nr:hypothetical protein BLN97_06035 [Bradyrhizobium elkanii]